MSITPTLRATGRSAYRALWRTSSAVFAGDDTLLTAFRHKMRTETVQGRSQLDPTLYSQNVQHACDVAQVLERNIVQAVKSETVSNGVNKETWTIKMRDSTELGDNETIKNPAPMESSRQSRKREKEAQNLADLAKNPPDVPRFYSSLKKASKQRMVPELDENDLEESFVRGSGPGGQSINKTNNNVQLIHVPTGLRVVCQKTRSLELNRMFARRLLVEKLDKIQNPGLSKGELARAKQNERERRRRKKAKKKDQAKQQE